MTDLNELAARCESAETGSRELDDAIALALNLVPDAFRAEQQVYGAFWNGKPAHEFDEWRTPEFTNSIDAIQLRRRAKSSRVG